MKSLHTLVMAARNGDARAFGELVDRFRDMALATCHPRIGDLQLAQDAVQEAFLDAWQCLGQLREPAAFAGWFRRILGKHADRQTRIRRPASVSPDMIDALIDEAKPQPDADFDTDHRARVVRQAVAGLPESLRDVTILFYLEGYSIKDIATFLDISASAAKKRLFLARKRLGERELAVVEKRMKTETPDAGDDFTRTVKFYVALRSRDLTQTKAMILQHPELVSAQFEWGVGSDSHYWPLGATPLFWAVATDDEPLFSFLVSEGADVNVTDRHGFSPLHVAVQLRRPAMIRQLLLRGARIDEGNGKKQTALMLAVQRNDEELVQLLLEQGADVRVVDDGGRSAADWALAKGHAPLATLLQDRGAAVRADITVHPAIQVERSQIFETGIKIVDLFTPFPRGGHVGLFSPLAGVGVGVLTGQLVQNAVDLHDARVVFTSIEEGGRDRASLDLLWRSELGLSEDVMSQRLFCHFAEESASADSRRETVEAAMSRARSFIESGHDVLHIIDDRLAVNDQIIALARDAVPGDAAVTTLWLGHYTVGLEPDHYAFLDGVICFSRTRAGQRLFPAVDPINSWSRLGREAPNDEHARLAREARATLLRYGDLHTQYEYRGFDSLFYLHHLDEDRTIVNRARRLDRFLTQPFVGVEAYTGNPGRRVRLAETLEGVGRILAGEADTLDEVAFEYVGALDEALAVA